LLTSDLFDLFSTDAADMEESLAQAGDLLALEKAGPLKPEAAAKLATLRAKLQHQIVHALLVGVDASSDSSRTRLVLSAQTTRYPISRFAGAQ
jgi:hypothetical protein